MSSINTQEKYEEHYSYLSELDFWETFQFQDDEYYIISKDDYTLNSINITRARQDISDWDDELNVYFLNVEDVAMWMVSKDVEDWEDEQSNAWMDVSRGNI